MYKVAQREFLDTVRTRTFILGLVFVPAIVIVAVLLGGRLAPRRDGPRPPINVAVTSPSTALSDTIAAAFNAYNESHPQSSIILQIADTGGQLTEQDNTEKLRQGQLDAHVVLEGDLLGKEGTIRFYTSNPKPSELDALWTAERVLRDAVINLRYESRGLDRNLLAEIRNVAIQRVELGREQGQEREQGTAQRVARMMVPFAFMYLIFIGIVGMGQHMISSIIEEKNSRIIEVLLAVVSPFELMAGKIVGLAGVGLSVMILWGMGAYAAARWHGIPIDVSADLLVYCFIYYILGFLLFGALLAGVGSVCNTIKETQSLMMPLMLVFIVPMVAWPRLVQEPNGELARVLSYVPLATPMVMILRLSSDPDIWMGEVVASIVVLALGVLVAIWAAAKIFRTGILLYGKRPGPREILRWLREK